jgi:hypothetical protein|tara:strand:- start:103 stop:342 length:240 start_codon:yes stop_codon:yes gene_type:complete
MAHENRKYVIINASEVGAVDFSQVIETSANTLRYKLDNSQTFVKFEGSTPSFLSGKTQYNHSEIRTILNGTDWAEEDPS